MPNKRLSIVLASFNDERIVGAIESIRRFDDIGTVRIILIDGGSRPEIVDLIRPMLTPDDVFVSEKDCGIFDAFNKGFDRCDTEFMGWLGSDDAFTGQLRASDIVKLLETHDLFVGKVAHTRGNVVRRMTHSFSSRFGLVRFGLNNPHFGTFGRTEFLKSERFEIDLKASDIAYFIRLFAKSPRVATSDVVVTIMEEGGFSNRSYLAALNINMGLVAVYRKYSNAVLGIAAVAIKLAYKASTVIYCRLFPVDRRSLER